MDLRIFQDVGLTKNETLVYLALLDLGKSSINKISERIGKHRRTIYDCLRRLEEKGLISYVNEDKTKLFMANNPQRFLDILNEKEEILEEEKKRINQILPSLILRIKEKKDPVTVTVHKGKEGLKTILEDITKTLKKEEEWTAFGSSGKGSVILPYYLDKWEEKRAKQGIKLKILFNNTDQGKRRAKELSKFKLTKIKFLPKGLISPADIYIYKNKISINLWSEDSPVSVLVENQEIADSFRNFFRWFNKNTKIK